MNIGFMGMGKLGLPCALAVEMRGHKVIGYDPSPSVQEILQTKKLPPATISKTDTSASRNQKPLPSPSVRVAIRAQGAR